MELPLASSTSSTTATSPSLVSPGLARRARLRLLPKDLYAELTKRRRRAQIAARHVVDQD